MKNWERRVPSVSKGGAPAAPGSELPADFLRLVEETLTQALAPGLAEIKKIHPDSVFTARGALFNEEILLSVTLSHGPQILSATTTHGSVDYRPHQEKPTVNELLALCVDSIGAVFQFYLDPEHPDRIAQIAESSLGALEEAPFEWTPLTLLENQKNLVHVKMDKSNPTLDRLAEDWLKKNDPHYSENVIKNDTLETEAAEDFLEERISAIRAAKSGSGGSGGPIRH